MNHHAPPDSPERSQRLGSRLLASSRFIVAFAVLGTFVSGTVLLIFAVLSVIENSINAFDELDLTSHGVEELAVEFIKLTDVFLLGTVLYIVSLGLYQLFIDATLPLPDWLIVHDLDHLKEKLVGVIIVLLGVSFLGEVVSWDEETDILRLGIAVALVIAALSIVLVSFAARSHASTPTKPLIGPPPAAESPPPPAPSPAPGAATNPSDHEPGHG